MVEVGRRESVNLASMPLMWAARLQAKLSVWRRTRSISTLSCGKVLTRSTRVLAGTVVAPSSSILAPIQQVMPSSRLVADSFSRPLSVASRMLPSTGRVLRAATARETTLRPLAKFSCRQDTFMRHSVR